ncbi:hypothetical protein [Pandoraea sputorum]|uniref:Uncharacterized protein n=1 Tax=Pandoraea sputorum TaxID=93222 RepID=A0A5E5BII8_9BURK|nr:hypothetical protein [Pandoraea sputorum]VVE84170.1 hypothetical protein PSP31121_04633 [Pandoraea sputorum]
MNANGVTNPPSITPSNFPVESAPPPSGSLPAELTATHQVATSQSLDLGMLDDWARIRGEFTPPDSLMDRWRSTALRMDGSDAGLPRDLLLYQDSLAETDKDPALVTTALVARIDELGADFPLHALTLLLDVDGALFDQSKLKTLAASRWIEFFPENERDQVRALIKRSLSAG